MLGLVDCFVDWVVLCVVGRVDWVVDVVDVVVVVVETEGGAVVSNGKT